MHERNSHSEILSVQSGAAFLDINNTSVTNLFESLVNFGKNESQNMLLPEVKKTLKTTSCPICYQRYK